LPLQRLQERYEIDQNFSRNEGKYSKYLPPECFNMVFFRKTKIFGVTVFVQTVMKGEGFCFEIIKTG
jgi:hypothetical protein